MNQEWSNKPASEKAQTDEDFYDEPEWKGSFEDPVMQDLQQQAEKMRQKDIDLYA